MTLGATGKVVARVAGLAWVSLAVLGCDRLWDLYQRAEKVDQDPQKAKVAREQRQQPATDLAVAPLPKGMPLVEREGNDAWGYPRSYVDLAAIRSLLHHGKYTELTQYFEHFQQEFEKDPAKEYWLFRATQAFYSAEPELLPKLDAWAAALPFSFAPYLARGTHRVAVVWAKRGERAARETPTADMQAMRDAAPLARKDLDRALQINPKLLAAHRFGISLAMPIGDREAINTAMTHAKQICPTCISVSQKYMNTLEPRWGGSFDAMEHFARTQANPANSKTRLLEGFILVERSRVERAAKDFEEALRHADAACAIGDWPEFFAERADVYAGLEDFPKAVTEIDRAIALLPQHEFRMARARYRTKVGDWEGAAADLIATIQVEPTDSDAHSWRRFIAKGVSDQGWQAHEKGDRTTAIRLLELAEQLDFSDQEIRTRKEKAIRGNVTGKADELAALEAIVHANPDDLKAHQQLDFAYAKKRKFSKVIAMWTAYLERHPNDGTAYFERSGAYYNSGKRDQAFADVEKACALGHNTACNYAKRMPR
jgi:tetratricopeptide (TPR) repeat protein